MFNSTFPGLWLRPFNFLHKFKSTYMLCVFNPYICVCLLMDGCMHIYIYIYISYTCISCFWPWKRDSTLYRSTSVIFCLIRQAKGLKSKAWNPYQPPPALSFRNKLKFQTFSTLLFLWCYKMSPKSLSSLSQRQRRTWECLKDNKLLIQWFINEVNK